MHDTPNQQCASFPSNHTYSLRHFCHEPPRLGQTLPRYGLVDPLRRRHKTSFAGENFYDYWNLREPEVKVGKKVNLQDL